MLFFPSQLIGIIIELSKDNINTTSNRNMIDYDYFDDNL